MKSYIIAFYINVWSLKIIKIFKIPIGTAHSDS